MEGPRFALNAQSTPPVARSVPRSQRASGWVDEIAPAPWLKKDAHGSVVFGDGEKNDLVGRQHLKKGTSEERFL